MSMVSAPTYYNEQSTGPIDRAATLDVTVSIKNWVRCGTFLGANVGIILGAIFVAIPFSAEISSFGLARALLVGVFACAVTAPKISDNATYVKPLYKLASQFAVIPIPLYIQALVAVLLRGA